MELRSIRIFVLTAKYLNFSKVADILFLSQSSISKYISALENELGNKLLTRDTKTVQLTEFGRAFLPQAEALLNQEEQMMDFVHRYKGNQIGHTLRLGVGEALMMAPPSLMFFHLIKSVNQFYEQEPKIHVRVKFYPEDQIRDLICNGSLDIAVVGINVSQMDQKVYPGVSCAQLDRSNNYLLYPTFWGDYDTLDALLANVDSLTYAHDPVPQSITFEFLQKAKISPALHPCNNWMELFLNVLDGVGGGIVPETLLPLAEECGLKSFSLRDLNINSSVYAIWNTHSETEPTAQMIQILTNSFLEQA